MRERPSCSNRSSDCPPFANVSSWILLTMASSAFSTFPRCCLESNSRSAAMRGSCHCGYFNSGVITNGLRLSELALTSFFGPSGVPEKGRKRSHSGSLRVISPQRRELWTLQVVVGLTSRKLVVCDPRRNALLLDGNQNDRVDAHMLFDLLYMNKHNPVYHGDHGGLDRSGSSRFIIRCQLPM